MTRQYAQQAASPPSGAQFILLAAGKGTRMMELTASMPKTLIPILRNRSILEINVQNVVRSRLAENIHVVGGHAWPRLLAHLDRYDACEVPVDGILNDDYAVAGPCRSIQLALAKTEHSDRIIIANGDTLFTSAAFRYMKRLGSGLFLLGSRVRGVEGDDLVIDCDGDRSIRAASKADVGSADAIISSGMFAAVGAEAINLLSDALAAVLKREEEIGRHLPWHDVLRYFSARGAPARLLLINRGAWHEFDSVSCIARFHGEHREAFFFPEPAHVADRDKRAQLPEFLGA
jgi:choline kinase